jgi:hypothetical protein
VRVLWPVAWRSNNRVVPAETVPRSQDRFIPKQGAPEGSVCTVKAALFIVPLKTTN